MVNLTHWTPRTELEPFTSLTRDPFFRRFFNLMEPDLEEGNRWLPGMNVYETKENLVVEIDIPGIDPKSVEINLQGQTLSVTGERRVPEFSEDVRVHRHEPAYGRFQRTVQLPVQIDPEQVKAKADMGVMTITLPKAREYVGRQIPIEIK
jgi:HSP20 family protein